MSSDRRREEQRQRRKARKQMVTDVQRTARTWTLFGEAMRFAHAHSAPGADVFNILRFGRDENGSVLDHFCTLHPSLTASERDDVHRFVHAFSSVFQVDEARPALLLLTDLVTGRTHTVTVADGRLAEGTQQGQTIATLVVPTHDGWLLGGTVRRVRDDVPPERLFAVVRRLGMLEADRVRAANPGITRAMLDDLVQAFTAHFGADHLIDVPDLALGALADFHRSWQAPTHEGYVNAGSLESDLDFQVVGRLGIIADPLWGYALVPELHELMIAVRTQDDERVHRWLHTTTHPAAFRCAWRNHPEQTEAILQRLLGEDWAATAEHLLERQHPAHFPPRPNVLPLPEQVLTAPLGDEPAPRDGIGLAALLAD